MTKGAHKGSAFERHLCTTLSLWWTEGKRDDIFWRSSCSGGRATIRSRKNKKTSNQYGDITAIDSIGQPLLDLCIVEAKRGYKDSNIACMVDRPRNIKQQTFEAWIEQSVQAMENADSFAWLLIVKRDRRETMVYMPDYLARHLKIFGGCETEWKPQVVYVGKVKFTKGFRRMGIVGTHLDVWLKNISKKNIKRALRHAGEE